jgi:hypothetical protein
MCWIFIDINNMLYSYNFISKWYDILKKIKSQKQLTQAIQENNFMKYIVIVIKKQI